MLQKNFIAKIGKIKFGNLCLSLLACLGLFTCAPKKEVLLYESPYVEILFLGHESEHHNSEVYMPILASALVTKGIHFTYASDPEVLTKADLYQYDGIALYANHDSITTQQNKALLNYVKSGKGFIPIHCASYCFRNSDEFVKMLGGQFKSHGTDTFTTTLTELGKNHELQLTVFETWDETYVHDKINPDIEVLMERIDGDHKEPWTWLNNYGKGRVFYTAYGHDEQTWANPGFHELMAKGILWAVGETVAAKTKALSFPNPEYTEAEIPNYEKRDPPLKLQATLSPEQSMQMTQVPIGFELELFAQEPDIINPIAISWDEKGRLWVIETVDYPNTVRNEDGIGDDRIKICEDTDGDGKADKFTVFADKLNIPTSMVFANDGIIVAQAPHFLFLQDTDGDDKADVRKILNSGWGTYDTHAGPSNLKYGFDNKIWGTVGYSGVKDTVNNNQFGQALFRMEKDGSKLEKMVSTSNNTWGLGFSENFEVFASTANNTHSVYMGIPDSYFANVSGLPRNQGKKIDGHYLMHPITQQVRQVDVFGGFTAAAGHNLYTARSFPKEYWNRIAFVCEPTGRLIHRAILEDDGAGFKEVDGWNLVASHDNWFGPVHAEVGPDGAVWIADWYNFIIQHNPTPPGFDNGDGNAHINPLRDKAHGRIYRLSYKGAPTYTAPNLSKDNPGSLIAGLKNDNLFWRLTAQRMLVENGDVSLKENLLGLIADQSKDEIGINAAAIHAIWTLDGLGLIGPEMDKDIADALVKALDHTSAGVRRAAIQVLPKTEATAEALLAAGVLKDNNKHTQLAALLSLSEMPEVSGLEEVLLDISENKNIVEDEWLSKAAYITLVRHKEIFLESLQQRKPQLLAQLLDNLNNKVKPYAHDIDISSWKSVTAPAAWAETDIGDIEGVIWFAKEIELPAALAGKSAKISFGRIDESDQTWVNGLNVGGIYGAWWIDRTYELSAQVLNAGKNIIAVKISNNSGRGGFIGKAEEMKISIGAQDFPLAGEWKYYIESQASKSLFASSDALLETFLSNYKADAGPTSNLVEAEDWPEDAKVINIKTLVNQMKYDRDQFEVEAGEAVELRFQNNDFMQHNLLILEKGSLLKVGKAADVMAKDKDAATKNYTPEMPEVLYKTALVNPNSEVVLRFIAPDKPGFYPFVCTFPGHWKIMNGMMKVSAKDSTL